MESIILPAYAKINLSLNILPELGARGYYLVDFINIQVSLADSLQIREIPERNVYIDMCSVDGGENIALKAAQLMLKRFNLPRGVSIILTKRIPSRAGLGGGSSDAAEVINGMNELFGLRLTQEEKVALAGDIGMDVCYCVTGGLCRVQGIGNVITRLPYGLPSMTLLVASPPEKKVSTAWAYSILKGEPIGTELHRLQDLLEGIISRNLRKIAKHIHNDFEHPIEARFPVVGEMKRCMLEHGALRALIAGSGLSVFGVYEDGESTGRARSILEERGIDCFTVDAVER